MDCSSSPFLAACRGARGAHVPVWFMRQAGRALPEYRSLRGTESILDAVRHPELVAEITAQPVRRYGVDAAILFSDIVVPVAAMGMGIEIVAGRGPVVSEPIRDRRGIERLRAFEPDTDAPFVADAVRLAKAEVEVPLIGFAGAPFTVASYLVEGGPSRTFTHTKALMYTDEGAWFALMDRLAEIALASLAAQCAAGCDAVQLFDSWAGALSRRDYERYVLPATTRVLSGLGETGRARIHFGVGTGELLGLMAKAGAEVVGVDWRTSLGDASGRVGPGVALQGNLDPALPVAGLEPTLREAARILEEGAAHGAHVFNLGHGVLPETDPGILAELVSFVHAWQPSR